MILGHVLEGDIIKIEIFIKNLRLRSLVSIVSVASLARSDGGVVNELEKVLSESGNDGELLGVLAKGVELVGEGGLELLAGDVGKLGLSNERLCLGTDKLLLKNNNLGGVGLLVLELSNLIGDFLLAFSDC